MATTLEQVEKAGGGRNGSASPPFSPPTFPNFLRAVAASHSPTVAKALAARELLKSWGVQKAAMAEASGTLGGYAVPPELSLELLKSLAEKSFIYPRALKLKMASRALQCPTVNTTTAASGKSPFQGGVSWTWGTSEGAAITESEPAFGSNDVVAWDLVGYSKLSNQFLADLGPEGEGFLVELFAREAAWQAEYAFLQGTGTGNQMPLGMLNSGACINVVRNSATDVKAVDIATMVSKLIPESWRNAIWVTNPTTLVKIMQLTQYQMSQGDPGRDGASVGYLISRPVFVTEKLPALGTLGDLMLVDPSMYVIGERQEVVVDADPHSLFTTNQTVFRVWLRIGGLPWLNAPVTLADGSTVASSIVALK